MQKCGRGFLYPCLKFKRLRIENPKVASDGPGIRTAGRNDRSQKIHRGHCDEKPIELLEQQVRELKREKEQLGKENIRLQKALNKKDLNLLKNL